MIVDFHTHVFPPSFRRRREEYLARDATLAALFSNPRARMATGDELVEAMDQAQVDLAVVMGLGWTDRATAREANDYILESASRYPRRLVGLCSVNPAWGEDAVREVERCAAAGARGIGELHPDTQGLGIGDKEAMAAVMEAALSLDLIVVIHASEPVGHLYPGKGNTTPDKLYAFVRNFPQNRIVCAHWGGGLPFYSVMPEVAEALALVYFDTAASPLLYDSHIFSAIASLNGADRVLFGTDFPLVGYRRALKQVEEADLDPHDEERILGLNAAELLGL